MSLPSSQDNNLLQRILLFLTLIVLPFQYGKHFWPAFSYIQGQRIDYLSPTIYVSDILIFSLLIITIFQKRLQIRRPVLLGFFGTLLYLSFGIFFSSSPMSGWYFLGKIFEYAFFVWFITRQKEKILTQLFWTFFIGVFAEGILGILQFLHQGSIGGLWYFLGERTFSASTPGIANATIYGQMVLRPYATFSHPNVFAGYMVIALFFFLVWIFITKSRLEKILSGIVLAFGLGVLFLTLSRVAIVTFIFLSLLFLILKFARFKYRLFWGGTILILGIFWVNSFLAGRFLDISGYSESILLRNKLMQASTNMFFSAPLFGLGLGNFLPSLPFYISSKLNFGFLQPVHNIFLLVLTETGIVGLSVLLFVLALAFAESFKKLKANSFFSFSFLSLLAICCIGLTDHYFITLQQGQMLFALVLGLCFSSPKLLKSYK